jgi:hypothetical protein
MGYGEFGGGGSVLWRVTHGQGGGGQGHDPKGRRFGVWINGQRVGGGDTNSTYIVVGWDDDLTDATTVDEIKARDPHQRR